MGYDLQFVDSIAASPTVRLNLNGPGWTVRLGTEFGMPELRRSVVSSMLVDGDRYPAAAYGGRMLTLVLRVDGGTDDATASRLQLLYRELDRPTNILLYRPGTTAPVFFRTFRCGPDSVVWDPTTQEVRVQVPAEPFALGLKETLPTVTVYNDPAEGSTLNANPNFDVEPTILNSNPNFETTAAPWTATGGTVARSTTQAHQASASLLLTPDGVTATVEVRSENASGIVVGQPYAVSAWVRCAVARSVNANIVWRDAGGGFLSSAGAVSFPVAAGTWTPIEMIGVAPASAAQAQISVSMGSTPPGSNTLHIDEAKLQPAAATSWAAVGGTVARSTAQSHEGVASLLFTPDGVTASVDARTENVAVTVGQQYRASAWVRSTVARSVSINLNWRDSGGGFLSLSTTTTALAAGTWTLMEVTGTAPASAASVLLTVSMSSTPPSSNTLHVDEARLRQAGGVGGMSFDVTSPKGDVEAPLFLSVRASDVAEAAEGGGSGRRQSVFAVRRGGTPSAMPAVLQAESLTAGIDTSVQAASGSSGTFLRTTFATATSLQVRADTSSGFPSAASVDARGTYRVFVRCRKSVSGDSMQMQMRYVSAGTSVTSDLVAGPAGTVWRWVDMGLVQMPLGYDPGTDGLSGVSLPVGGMAVNLYAARTSGSGTLDLDVVMFVPADDRLSLVKWPESYTSETAYVVDAAAGQAYGVGSAGEVRASLLELIGGTPMVTPGVANRIWMIRDAGSTRSGGDDVSASVQVTPSYWPRYLYTRGAS